MGGDDNNMIANRNIALFVGYGRYENIVQHFIRKRILPQRKDTDIVDVESMGHLERIVRAAKTASHEKRKQNLPHHTLPHKIIIVKPQLHTFLDYFGSAASASASNILSLKNLMKSSQGRELFYNGRWYNFSVLMITDQSNHVFIDNNIPLEIRVQFDLWCIQLMLLENMKSHSDLKFNYNFSDCPIDHTLSLETIFKEKQVPMHSCILQDADVVFPQIKRKYPQFKRRLRQRDPHVSNVFHTYSVLNGIKKRKRLPKGLLRDIQHVNVEKYLVVPTLDHHNYQIVDFSERIFKI